MLEKKWLEKKLRNDTGTWSWLAENLRSKNLNVILKMRGHPQDLLSRGLATPDVVFGNRTQVVGGRDNVKGSDGHKARLSSLGWSTRRQQPRFCTSS